jgi:hypothetical protein
MNHSGGECWWWGRCVYVKGRGIWKCFVLSTQFCCEPDTKNKSVYVYKNKSFLSQQILVYYNNDLQDIQKTK